MRGAAATARLVPHLDVELQALPALLQHLGHPVGDPPRGEVGHLAGLLDLGQSGAQHGHRAGRCVSPGRVPGWGHTPRALPLVPLSPGSSPACAAPGTRCSASPPCAAGHCTAPPPGTPAPPHPHHHPPGAGGPTPILGTGGTPQPQDQGGLAGTNSLPNPFNSGVRVLKAPGDHGTTTTTRGRRGAL